MSIRKKVRSRQAPEGACASPVSLHMTTQTAVLIETLVGPRRLGALGPPATSSRPRTRPPRPSAATGVPVFAWKGETLEEYWDCTLDAVVHPDGKGPRAGRR